MNDGWLKAMINSLTKELVPPIAVCVVAAGCSCKMTPERQSSPLERNSYEGTSLQNREQNYTILPPGTYTPLPPTLLLGAANLQERDDISEALIRHLAAKSNDDPEFRYRFIGFEGLEAREHDPSEELLQRIRKLKLAIEPVSTLKESVMQEGERSESEQAKHGMTYFIFDITRASEDQVDVDVNECPGYGRGGQRWTYSLLRKNGRWTITKEQPGPVF